MDLPDWSGSRASLTTDQHDNITVQFIFQKHCPSTNARSFGCHHTAPSTKWRKRKLGTVKKEKRKNYTEEARLRKQERHRLRHRSISLFVSNFHKDIRPDWTHCGQSSIWGFQIFLLCPDWLPSLSLELLLVSDSGLRQDVLPRVWTKHASITSI